MRKGLLAGCHNLCRQEGCLGMVSGLLGGSQGWIDGHQLYIIQKFTTTPLSLSLGLETFYRFRNPTSTARSPQSNMNPSTHPRPNATNIDHINSFNQTNSNNITTNITYVNKRTKLLNWLSPLQPRVRHNDVRARRQDGIGEWFLRADEFLGWRDGKGEFGKATLFCSGNPGVGKTFLR